MCMYIYFTIKISIPVHIHDSMSVYCFHTAITTIHRWIHGVQPMHTPKASQFFNFDKQNWWNVAVRGVGEHRTPTGNPGSTTADCYKALLSLSSDCVELDAQVPAADPRVGGSGGGPTWGAEPTDTQLPRDPVHRRYCLSKHWRTLHSFFLLFWWQPS